MINDVRTILYKPLVPILLSVLFLLLALWQGISSLKNIKVIKNSAPSNQIIVSAQVKKDKVSKTITAPLFGEYVPESLSNTTVKESMLNLKVVGVLFSNKESNSQVIIRTASGEEHSYRVGDVLPGGVTIKRITAQGVLVSREGSLESLSLPKNDLLFHPQDKPLEGDEL